MTNQEKAIKAKELVGDNPPNKLFFHQINGAYYLIYGENMKRTCLNALIDAHRKIHNFIKPPIEAVINAIFIRVLL